MEQVPLNEVSGHLVTITIGDKDYTAHKLRVRDLGAMKDRLHGRLVDSAEERLRGKALPPEQFRDRMRRIEMTPIGNFEVAIDISNMDTIAHILYLCIKPHHPEFREDVLGDMPVGEFIAVAQQVRKLLPAQAVKDANGNPTPLIDSPSAST